MQDLACLCVTCYIVTVVVNNKGFIDCTGDDEMIWLGLLVLVVSLFDAVLCAVKLGGEADDKAEVMREQEVEK